jgi:DNA-binding MarR family transcriptional regulator
MSPTGHDARAAGDPEDPLAAIERSLSYLTRLSRPSRVFGVDLDADGRVVDRAEYAVLARLAEFGPIRLTDLANVMEIDISTASRQVRALDIRGLVARTGLPDDQRTAHLRLTSAGEDVLERSRAQRVDGIKNRLSGWNDRDLASLARLLGRLARDLSGRTGPQPPTGRGEEANAQVRVRT